MQQPERFAAVSRGDFVAGLFWPAAAGGANALVLVTPPLGADMQGEAVRALCEALRAAGLNAAALDLPLQGERANAKLSPRLVQSAGTDERSASERLLWEEFLRQAALDLEAVARALAARPSVRCERIACAAFVPGAEAGAHWAARSPATRRCLALAPSADPLPIARALREQLR